MIMLRLWVAMAVLICIAPACGEQDNSGVFMECDVPVCFLSHGYDQICVGAQGRTFEAQVERLMESCRRSGTQPQPGAPGCRDPNQCFVRNCREVGTCCINNC